MPRIEGLSVTRNSVLEDSTECLSSSLNKSELREFPRAMEKDHSIKSVESKGASVSHSSGGKIP